MATLYTVLCAIQAQVSAVTQGLISTSPDTNGRPLTVEVGLYWPSAKALQNNVRPANGPAGLGPTSLVTVYDRGLAADSTRWLPTIIATCVTPATMTVLVSPATVSVPIAPVVYLLPGQSATLTFGGPITAGDAVGVSLAPFLGGNEAVVPVAVAGDTPATMAAKLVSMLMLGPPSPVWLQAIDSMLPTWITATAVGPVVTITSKLAVGGLSLNVNIGNGGTQTREIGRRKRHFQIVVWSRTPDDRITVSDPIEALIAAMESDFGLTFPDGTMGRLTFSGDIMHDEATLSDTLRRDFMVCVDYGISTVNATYAVLAPILQTTTF